MSPTELEEALFVCQRLPFSKDALMGREAAVARVLSAASLFVSPHPPMPSVPDSSPHQVEGIGFAWVPTRQEFVTWDPALLDHMSVLRFWEDTNRMTCDVCQSTAPVTQVSLSGRYTWTHRDAMILCRACAPLHPPARYPTPRLAFVAESPTGPGLPLGGPSGANLCRLLDIPHQDFWQRHTAINLLPAGTHRPSRMPERMFLRLHALGMRPFLECGAPAVALGRRVATALADGPPVGELYGFPLLPRGSRRVLSLPHPSGRCRAWNDPDVRRRAALALRAHAEQ